MNDMGIDADEIDVTILEIIDMAIVGYESRADILRELRGGLIANKSESSKRVLEAAKKRPVRRAPHPRPTVTLGPIEKVQINTPKRAKRRKMSKEARKRIAEAQRKRWANVRKAA